MVGAELIGIIESAGVRVRLVRGEIRLRCADSAVRSIAAKHVKRHRDAVVAALESRCKKCGAVGADEVPIHGGSSSRLDCRRCGSFISFSKWRDP